MSLAAKLQLKAGQALAVINAPDGVDLGDVTVGRGDAVLVFVHDGSELVALGGPAIDAARADRLAWIAYPKGGQLGTDLDRDKLWKRLVEKGVRGVRQISIDSVWSALRFRPAPTT